MNIHTAEYKLVGHIYYTDIANHWICDLQVHFRNNIINALTDLAWATHASRWIHESLEDDNMPTLSKSNNSLHVSHSVSLLWESIINQL